MPGTDGGFQIARTGAEVAAISPTPFSTIRLTVPPPAGVKHAYSTVLWVDKNNRQAIGSLNRQQQTWGPGDEAISYKLRFPKVNRRTELCRSEPGASVHQRQRRELLPLVLRAKFT